MIKAKHIEDVFSMVGALGEIEILPTKVRPRRLPSHPTMAFDPIN
jgi:hypothetical protein